MTEIIPHNKYYEVNIRLNKGYGYYIALYSKDKFLRDFLHKDLSIKGLATPSNTGYYKTKIEAEDVYLRWKHKELNRFKPKNKRRKFYI